MQKGKFIVIEGADGSGKKTQFDLLSVRIKKELKRSVYEIDFPQYEQTFFGKLVGRYLTGEFGDLHEVSPYLASLTYAGDRWQASKTIKDHLQKGEIVLANRYALSNMAHQSARLPKKERNKFLKFLGELEYETYGIPKEDLNIFLKVPAEIGQKLIDKKGVRKYIKGKKKDINERNLKFQIDSINMYSSLAKRYKGKIKVINCVKKGELKSIEEVHELVWNLVQDVLQ